LLDIENGTIADVVGLGVLESFNVKMAMVASAAEAAEQVSDQLLSPQLLLADHPRR
jgi:hypothetical protein